MSISIPVFFIGRLFFDSISHWSMYTSLCRYLRVLPVRHTPIFWNKMAATHLLTAEVVGVFIFVVVNTA